VECGLIAECTDLVLVLRLYCDAPVDVGQVQRAEGANCNFVERRTYQTDFVHGVYASF